MQRNPAMKSIQFVGLASLLLLPIETFAQQPSRQVSKSYSVQCKLSRQYEEYDANGRLRLERSTTTLPDIVTLENSRSEYITERKSDSGTFQFRVSVQIIKVSEGKVRLELQLEDTWTDGPLDKPRVHRHALQTARQTALGSKLKISLQEKNDRDESIIVELNVKELDEEE